MKKKTALTLSAAALVSAGVAFGVKFKQEKDEFEKVLKEVLIPDADKKLDDLRRENVALNDSIIEYEDALKQIKPDKDSVSAITKNVMDHDFAISGAFSELNEIVRQLGRQRTTELDRIFYDKFGNYEAGGEGNWIVATSYLPEDNPEAPTDKKSIELYKKVYHRTGNTSSHFPVVPSHGAKYFIKKPFSLPEFEVKGPYYDGGNAYLSYSTDSHVETDDVERFFAFMSQAERLVSTIPGMRHGDEWSPREYWVHNDGAKFKLEILKSCQSFIDAVDNSQNVFDPKTFTAFKEKVKEMRSIVEKEFQLEQQMNAKQNKLKSFEKAKESVKENMKIQQKHWDYLNNTRVSKLMRDKDLIKK